MKDILLTGGAGGLGSAVCMYFAQRGCRVFCCDITSPQQVHEHIVPFDMDVRSAQSIQRVCDELTAISGGLDAVIHMAGVYMMDSFAEISEERLAAMLDINLLGVYRVNKVFLPLLRKGNGRIIIITSELDGQKPLPFSGVYALSKTALGYYADALRLELQLLGVTVTKVRSGAFQTQLLDTSMQEMERMCAHTRLYKTSADKLRAVMQRRMKASRLPAELAKLLYHIATARRPRPVYTINASFELRLYSLLPRRVQAFLIRRLLG